MSYEARSLKEVLIARWDILPDHVKRTHWHKFTFEEKWLLTYQRVNFDSWRYITFVDWDIEFNAGLYAEDEDSVMALQSVFEDRQEHPEILEVLFYPSAKEGPSLPTHLEILYWNGNFRYADVPELNSILDPRMNKVEFYHPWGFWNQFDCHAQINVKLIGPLLVLRFGDHPPYSGPSHKELTIGMRQLSYKLFHTRTKVLYRVLSDYVPCDTENVFSKWGWGLDTTPSESDYQQAEDDSLRIAIASCRDVDDIISRELGGKWFFKDGYAVSSSDEGSTNDEDSPDSDVTNEEPEPISEPANRWLLITQKQYEAKQRRLRLDEHAYI
ncbi:hypothetical protein HYPSUDRAFT_208435 [Hypholoma sublateritium FD-334 SS-4]|uniref:Uncharacterized protein n=1 Tax=Hypholoma sublateritium (strain FD-334 SS-4) TaxID=945553 RepID=A0A0D2P2I7_HYPSF|nr:hypothetical protein HYPSUDRAFT_208435 [Hypholoma sublateritium FD-334 SS-4]